jgi:zinc transport system substrate-binding protein
MWKMKKLLLLVLAGFLPGLISISGCSADTVQKDEDRIVAAVSIVPEKAFVEAVCGDLAEIVVLIPPGYSPSSYELSPNEMASFRSSDIYFTIGVSAEESSLLPVASENKDLMIVNLHEAAREKYPEIEIAEGQRDQHIWLSPKRVIAMAHAIADGMSLADPENAAAYRANAADYIAKLEELDSRIREKLKGTESRSFIVFHPAFGYLADDYGLLMHALEESGKEASPQRIRELVDMALEEEIKVVFYQAEISSRQVQSFAGEIGAELVQLDPLSENYIGNLEMMVDLISGGAK